VDWASDPPRGPRDRVRTRNQTVEGGLPAVTPGVEAWKIHLRRGDIDVCGR
jgi:hypothetical protein